MRLFRVFRVYDTINILTHIHVCYCGASESTGDRELYCFITFVSVKKGKKRLIIPVLFNGHKTYVSASHKCFDFYDKINQKLNT